MDTLGIDLIAGLDQHFGDCAVALGMQCRLHLHRLDGQKHVAGLDRLAGGNGERRDDARIGAPTCASLPGSALRRDAHGWFQSRPS